MEKVRTRSLRDQYLSLLVKEICKDRLNLREREKYSLLKIQVDPLGSLELELAVTWKIAEKLNLGKQLNITMSKPVMKKFSLQNIFYKSKAY